MIQIGEFQLLVREFAKANKLADHEVNILLYASEHALFTQYEIMKKVPCCKPSVIKAMKNLTEKGWVKIAIERHPGVSRKYRIAGKGRLLVDEFNIRLNNV